ncbi:MFS transporter [Leptolyngbya sp. 'hensonii']|uniref:MFS transporter n=1 Tax=Leptolyngbya sp. 'hensonii' TaxID=1922337 RepID=UPI00095015A2|nr:MFS transporter [Leptolyngbya sp. 'hensonii']OLP19315.1 MFS transporter [Leptolyngbya sp. 'hensonii']
MKTLNALEPGVKRDLLTLFSAGFLFWTSLASLLPVLSLYVESLGGSRQEIGVVMGAFAVGLLLFRAQLGKLADRRSRKLVLLIGMAVVAIAPLGYGVVQSVPLLILLRAFHGISIAAFTTAYSALVVDLAPPQARGELIGYMTLVNPIGMALGPAMGGFLQDWLGYTPLFLLSASLGFIGLFCAARVQESSSQERGGADPRVAADQFWSLLWEPRIRIPTLILLMVGLAFGALSSFIPLFIKETGATLNPGLFYTAAAIASFMIRILAGQASDRYGRGLFITISLILYTAAMGLVWGANSAQDFLLAGFLEGLGAGMLIPMVAALMADRSGPHERARMFGLCLAGFDLGIALAGPGMGVLAAAIGYRHIFGVAGGLTLIGLLMFLTLSSKNLSWSLRFALGQTGDVYALPRP